MTTTAPETKPQQLTAHAPLQEIGKTMMGLAKLEAEVNDSSVDEKFAHEAKITAAGIFRIVVMGEIKKGKSSFINALLGTKGLVPCLLYTSPSPRDRTRSRMPSSA